MVMAASPPASAARLVQRLLAAKDDAQRRALVQHARLDAETLRSTVLELCDEAGKLLGADPVRMERLCESAAVLAERSGDDYLRAMVLMRSGDAQRVQGRNAEACTAYDTAAALFRSVDRPVEAARTRIGWVHAMANLGRPDEAMRAARAARRVFAQHGEVFHLANLELNAGNLRAQHGHYVEALRRYRSALKLFDSLGEQGRIYAARCHANCGRALSLMGAYRSALPELETAREVYASMGEVVGAARITQSAGQNRMERGQYGAALRDFEAALSVFRDQRMWSEAVVASRNIADCYLHLNRPADALATLADVEEYLHRIDDAPDSLSIVTRKVAAQLMLGDIREVLSQTVDVATAASGPAIQYRAWLAVQRAVAQLRSGQPALGLDDALQGERLARAAGMRRLVTDAISLQGQAQRELGNMAGAEHAARRAIRLARELDAAPPLHRALELLGQVAESRERRAAAARYYAAAIEQLEREQRGVIFEFRDSFSSSRNLAYERLAALRLQAGRASAAFATAERAKSRALRDAIAGTIQLRPQGDSHVRSLAQDLQAARDRYAAASAHAALADGETSGDALSRAGSVRELTQLEARIVDLTRQIQLAAAGKEVSDLLGPVPDVEPPHLPQDTLLIEFFISGQDILRFRIGNGSVAGDILAGTLSEVERCLRLFHLNLDAVERARSDVSGSLGKQAQAILKRLYALLLGGLNELDRYRSLVIVPHGLLHYLPFHALYDGERYLVERAAVSYVPSAALWEVCYSRERRRRSGEALVLACSNNGSLPSTLAEAESVAATLGVPMYSDDSPARAALIAAGARADVIHIAAHGRFRPDAPLFSHVQLADGQLTTADVFDLRLRARLVVLSACETARAAVGGGDELVGLTRAWLYAGAAGLVVSQWRMEDAAAATLMRHFYQRFGQGVGAATALREAQREFIRNAPENGRAHPFYWAGFQSIGAGPRERVHRRTVARREEKRR